MAQKFGKGRWVKEGYFDNRVSGAVVGMVTFAGIGPVEMYLLGDCKGELAGRAVRFRNPEFEEEEMAGHVLADFESPHVGEVSLMSLDPHPLLSPHPYFEWFSIKREHYRIELAPDDARILSESEAAELDSQSNAIRQALSPMARSTRTRSPEDWP
jgi:hypothetical protein